MGQLMTQMLRMNRIIIRQTLCHQVREDLLEILSSSRIQLESRKLQINIKGSKNIKKRKIIMIQILILRITVMKLRSKRLTVTQRRQIRVTPKKTMMFSILMLRSKKGSYREKADLIKQNKKWLKSKRSYCRKITIEGMNRDTSCWMRAMM